MALQQPFDDDTGVHADAAYWRIALVTVSVADRAAALTVYAYLDADAREAGKAPLPGGAKSYSVNGERFDKMYAAHVAPGGPNMLQLAYGIVKQDPYFKDAKDV
jgi:hypothetical protein